jgi:hypothetical protein
MRRSLCVLVCIVSLAAIPSADVWDVNGDSDDGAGTDNELIHGSNQIHDLGVRPGPTADQDWYVIGQKRQSSYEIVVDGTSGDIGFNNNLVQRVTSAGVLIQNSVSTTPGLDYSRSLRWANTTAATVSTEFIRVGPGSCIADPEHDGYSHQCDFLLLERRGSTAADRIDRQSPG